jgi:hypothetical protein
MACQPNNLLHQKKTSLTAVTQNPTHSPGQSGFWGWRWKRWVGEEPRLLLQVVGKQDLSNVNKRSQGQNCPFHSATARGANPCRCCGYSSYFVKWRTLNGAVRLIVRAGFRSYGSLCPPVSGLLSLWPQERRRLMCLVGRFDWVFGFPAAKSIRLSPLVSDLQSQLAYLN